MYSIGSIVDDCFSSVVDIPKGLPELTDHYQNDIGESDDLKCQYCLLMNEIRGLTTPQRYGTYFR